MKALRIVVWILGGAAVLALVFFARKASAAGGGLLAGLGGAGAGDSGGSIDELMSRYEGKRLGDVPAGDRARLAAHAASFNAPPPKGGLLGEVLVPVPPGFRFTVPYMVREKPEERAKDLGAFTPAGWKLPELAGYVMARNAVHGQSLTFLDRAGGAIKSIANVGLNVAAPAVGLPPPGMFGVKL